MEMAEGTHRILIVDDDENLLRLLSETLEAIGYTALSANDGLRAIQMVKSEQIDLVIADISMPEMDGLQLLQQVKEFNQDIPVLLITGVNMNNIKDRVYQYGADAFLDKPFRISRIEQLLNRLLSHKGRRAKILVVDDNREFREQFASQLEELGFRVIEAADGGEALEKLSKDHIDSVVADYRMPDIDGLELAKRLKNDAPFTRVIIISGQALSPEDEDLLNESADAFLQKPFRLEQIQKMLNSFIKSGRKVIEK
ncbi:MAG TPA: response regulator [candidate division Zixibacteria bacterium]|nr:response regulator [candidate division Zixibacteria bacterium]